MEFSEYISKLEYFVNSEYSSNNKLQKQFRLLDIKKRNQLSNPSLIELVTPEIETHPYAEEYLKLGLESNYKITLKKQFKSKIL
jgi:hypothetical protein